MGKNKKLVNSVQKLKEVTSRDVYLKEMRRLEKQRNICTRFGLQGQLSQCLVDMLDCSRSYIRLLESGYSHNLCSAECLMMQSSDVKNEAINQCPAVTKRDPGRPKKVIEPVAVKRGPGRPKKVIEPVAVKRGPGRPKKVIEPVAVKRGPGRPRKA